MTQQQQAIVDAWIERFNKDKRNNGPGCIVYAGGGKWWPAEDTHDGPQPIEYAPQGGLVEFSLEDLILWCSIH